MHLTRPAATDLASRLEQLEHLFEQSRATLRGRGIDAPVERSSARMGSILVRIKRLTALVQSSLVRSDPDDVDRMTMQLLLADYAHVVEELRGSANAVAATLKAAAHSVAHTERVLAGDAPPGDKSIRT